MTGTYFDAAGVKAFSETADYDKVAETIQRVCDRGAVTMHKPLTPWGHTRFHKFLAIHIHNATRLAGDNDGMVDDIQTVQKWDLAKIEVVS